jgi:hypothetical protein
MVKEVGRFAVTKRYVEDQLPGVEQKFGHGRLAAVLFCKQEVCARTATRYQVPTLRLEKTTRAS